MNPKVDAFLSRAEKWQEELTRLRNIVAECQLNEELKWGVPCYTFQNSNVVLIHAFKDYCAILFFKGVLLQDAHKILIQQTKNVQAARQMRFTNLKEIIDLAPMIKTYIAEGMEVEKAGLKVDFKAPADFELVEEFEKKLNKFPALKTAFEKLTPGRKRAYLLHFSAPKQAKTREARIEKCIPQILNVKGLND